METKNNISRSEKFMRPEPPRLLFGLGLLLLLRSLNEIFNINIWVFIGLYLFFFYLIINSSFMLKKWYYTMWSLYILVFTLGIVLTWIEIVYF